MRDYDPDERRDTPLALELKELIRQRGPVSVEAYMEACLQDAEHGYYRKQVALGAEGDFITAPEISQVFGEIIGLWSAVVWQSIADERPRHLIELGPGRGTLMRDALRAISVVPGLLSSLDVTLVESNSALRQAQLDLLELCGVPLRWHPAWPTLVKSYSDAQLGLIRRSPVADGPAIIIGNEFLDVLPIQQRVRRNGAWHHRRVGLDARGELAFVVSDPSPVGPPEPLDARSRDGDVYCFSHRLRELLGGLILTRARHGPVAALLIDYGHSEPALGDTLQAVRKHRYESVFASPGEADLTAQVDFSAAGRLASHLGLMVDGPVTQAEFLGRLGIIERASRLMSANPAKAASIEAGVARLIAVPGMGDRFKVLGVRSPEVATLPGF